MRICNKCGVEKPFSSFHVDKSTRLGFATICKECKRKVRLLPENMKRQRANSRKCYERNKQLIFEKKRTARPAYNSSVRGRARILWYSAMKRAKLKNMEFALKIENVENLLSFKFCWATGLPFDFSTGTKRNKKPFSPSIDRVKNDEGYTHENIRLVCSVYNSGKNEHDELDFIAMCMAVAQMNENNTAAIDRLKELRNAGL